jgi:uncharacterized membrane protein
MQQELWLRVAHVVGAILWVAGLTAVLALLTVHPRVETASRALLSQVERRIAIVMDLGAAVTIAVGLYRAIDTHQFSNGGWLHVKLTAVVLGLLTAHGLARVKIKRFRTGDARPLPWTVWLLVAVGAGVATTFGAQSLLMRG